jgi:hypothetical protein
MRSPARRSSWWWSVAMVVAAVGSLAFYLFVVRSQGNSAQGWFVVAISAAAGSAAVGTALANPARRIALDIGTAIAAVVGLISATSVGGPLIATAALGFVALAVDWSNSSSPRSKS